VKKEFYIIEESETVDHLKEGKRYVIPIEKGKIPCQFGAKEYLIIDVKNGEIKRKEILKKPLF